MPPTDGPQQGNKGEKMDGQERGRWEGGGEGSGRGEKRGERKRSQKGRKTKNIATAGGVTLESVHVATLTAFCGDGDGGGGGGGGGDDGG